VTIPAKPEDVFNSRETDDVGILHESSMNYETPNQFPLLIRKHHITFCASFEKDLLDKEGKK